MTAGAAARPTTTDAQSYSSNWSGIVDLGSSGEFSQAYGYWPVPETSYSTTTSYSVSWVGLDGWNNGYVIQDGTGQCSSLSACQTIGFTAQYFAWYEVYPMEGMVEITNMSVAPGDTMLGEVYYSNGAANFILADVNSGAAYETSQATSDYIGENAEFIMERPSIDGSFPALARYGWEGWGEEEVYDAQNSTWYNSQQLSYTPVIMENPSGTYLSEPVGISDFWTEWLGYS